MLYVEKISESFHETSKEKKSLKVLGIYKDLIYIDIEDKVYAIQNKRVTMSPLSISIKDELDFRSLDLFSGDAGEMRPDMIRIKSLVIDIRSPRVIPLKLPVTADSDKFLKEITLWQDILRTVMTETLDENSRLTAEGNLPLKGFGEVILGMKGMVSVPDVKSAEKGIHVQEYFTHHVNDFISKYQVRKEASFESLSRVIGLGPGLTPSGDDFLSGLLSLLWYLDEEDDMRMFKGNLLEGMIPRVQETTPVSRAFLKAAMKGEFTESIMTLYKVMGERDLEESKIILRKISRLGHSSGTDTLAGMLFGMMIADER